MKVVPVILCGGSGTRMWPLSREKHPKQFVALAKGRTLFGDTLDRIRNFPEADKTIAVCNEVHRFFVSQEMQKAGLDGKIILEPTARNTAPAIALAACLLESDLDTLMLVMPADHYIADKEAFAATIEKAIPLAQSGKIVTFGVKPDRPATGYGYIRCGNPAQSGFEIAEFVEKPSLANAERMSAQEDFFWNAGIFLMKPETYLSELAYYAPKIASACKLSMQNYDNENEYIVPEREAFLQSPVESIDYAVMEKTRQAVMVPLETSWSDLGSWEAFFQLTEKDEGNNAIHGDVIQYDTHNSYLHSTGRLLATIGISDLLVVETGDAVVVANRKSEQRIKEVVADLKNSGRYHYKQHPLVYKPWGSYEVLALGDRFQVKRLTVNPGQSLSLQYHHHRAEHWVIVSGTAQIGLDGKAQLHTENQSVYIPVGCQHMLKNPGKIPLILIEVQSGNYLEEDDIIRISDMYGRKDTNPCK